MHLLYLQKKTRQKSKAHHIIIFPLLALIRERKKRKKARKIFLMNVHCTHSTYRYSRFWFEETSPPSLFTQTHKIHERHPVRWRGWQKQEVKKEKEGRRGEGGGHLTPTATTRGEGQRKHPWPESNVYVQHGYPSGTPRCLKESRRCVPVERNNTFTLTNK